MAVSYRPEVQADATGIWYHNTLRFATRKEAEDQVRDLSMRWTAVRETRVVETDDLATHAYVDGKAVLSSSG